MTKWGGRIEGHGVFRRVVAVWAPAPVGATYTLTSMCPFRSFIEWMA
jgi:hypothetical protein